MSRWVDVLNRLRYDVSVTRLVAAQAEAGAGIVDWLRTHDVVNLHGAPGSGKTYLGWVFARVTGARHLASPDHLSGPASIRPGPGVRASASDGAWTSADLFDVAIVDNCLASRLGARRVADDARWGGYRRVVLVTRDAVPDHVPKVALRLAPADLDAIAQALGSVGWASPAGDAQATSLWARIWSDEPATVELSAADTISKAKIAHV